MDQSIPTQEADVQTLGAPPVLSTPDSHILEHLAPMKTSPREQLADEEIVVRYEIERTLKEIREHGWRRVALQFPDEMLPDSVRVYQLIARGLDASKVTHKAVKPIREDGTDNNVSVEEPASRPSVESVPGTTEMKLTVLADTSYGSCCVDEIAAEHVEAEAVIHYGRACLSPTTRLPVVHVFTRQPLNLVDATNSFKATFTDQKSKAVVTADLPFSHHVPDLFAALQKEGYESVYAADIVHDPSSPIPNRTVPDDVRERPEELRDWRLFHLSKAPTALLLTLSSRVHEFRIYPTDQTGSNHGAKSILDNSSAMLRRRYALVTSLATVSIWGILINTLSVKDYLHVVDQVKAQIAAAGKKSYLFVVGKLNAAKLANFSEVGGWVVIGCWESSLIDSSDFYKPVITPFELQMALKKDDERVWTGDWSADFQRILAEPEEAKEEPASGQDTLREEHDSGEDDSEEESLPPEYDFRTGKYVSQTRPMRQRQHHRIESFPAGQPTTSSSALTRRPKGDIVAVNGVASPGADFLQSKRTWAGLGSDFNINQENQEATGSVQEGRSGIARGYVVGDGSERT